MSDDELSDTYVTTAAWRSSAGRADLIDEVADQFERPAARAGDEVAWPRRSRGWRSAERLHSRALDRRAG
jgi:hypothetical protein